MRDSNLTKICLLKLSDVTYISRVHRCANTFATCNYDVTVISIAPRIASKSNNYPYRNVRIFILSRILPGRIFLPVRAMEGFLRMLYKAFCAKSEVYMPHNWEALLIAYIVTRFNGAKLVYNADELEFDRNFQGNRFIISLKNRLRMFSDAFICWRCNAVIAADYARAKVIQKAYGLKRIDVVRNTPLAWHGESDNRIRRTLNLNSDTIIMLYQGMIDYGRGIEICIEALSTLNIGNVHFVLLGFSTESYRIKIEAIANKLCVAEFVHFLPPVPWFDLLDWTASADISMVLIENTCLSYYCAAPNKFYETIMTGTPYIASDFPEMRRVHDVVKGGILVDPSNLTRIVLGLKTLICDPKIRRSMGYRARSAALSELNWETEQKRLLRVIHELR